MSAILALLLGATVAAAPPLVFIDAGHGEGDNQGAQTVRCGTEADFTLSLARDLAARLEAGGRFRVRLSRTSSTGPSYPQRLARARAAGARALLSLHADARGALSWHKTLDGRSCLRSLEQPGFSVLYSDEGSAGRVARRRRLARAVATRMTNAGFIAYDGIEYGGLYEVDPTEGVFIDRRRLFMLRRPPMPSVIIETHHAFHPEDHADWQRDETRARFAAAVEAALWEALTPGVGRGG